MLSVATSLVGGPWSWDLRHPWLPGLISVGSLLIGSTLCPYFPTEDTYERRIMVDKEEVTLVVYDIWEQVRTKMWLQAGDEPGRTGEGRSLGLTESWWDYKCWFQLVVSSQRAKGIYACAYHSIESRCLSRII